jgi:ABC-type Zn uptake system ZnuABC Zn-binding protein ZnuA
VTAPHQRSRIAAGALAASLAVLLAACQPQARASTDTAVRVVATTTVFADLVQNVGGDLVSVTSLVPRGGDVHTYSARPADAQAVASAQLLVMNGLGLDDWLERIATNDSQPGTPLLKLGVGLPGVELLPGEVPGTQNPHLWMSVPYAELYVDRIAQALASVDPGHAQAYADHARAYEARLTKLDADIRAAIATLPAANRRIVTYHDAFPYFAREYGLTIVGVAVPAPGQDPSASEIADLIQAIQAAHVKAIFSEAQFPTRLVDQIAAETGASVVANLYDDSLGDQVDSYIAVMTWDVDQIVQALR